MSVVLDGRAANPENTTGEVQLSQWWKTDSCRQAYERADRAKRARLEKVRNDVAARRAELDAQIWKGGDQ